MKVECKLRSGGDMPTPPAHSRSKCTMQMTLYRVASIASPCENFQDDIITASLLYRTQFRVQIQGLIFQSLIA